MSVCVYCVSHREAEEVEEKEKEACTGRDRCGALTHSLTLSHSLRARLARAHTHAGSPGARKIPSAAEKLLRLSLRDFLFWEVHLLGGSSESAESCPRGGSGPRERRLPPPLLLELSAASKTIAAAVPSKAPSARRGPGIQAGLRPQDARPAWSPRATRAPGSGSCFAPVGAEPSYACKLSRGLE